MIKQGAKSRSLFCFVRYVMGDLLSEVFFAAHIQTLSEKLDFQPELSAKHLSYIILVIQALIFSAQIFHMQVYRTLPEN